MPCSRRDRFPFGADTGIVQQVQFTELADFQAFYPISANRRLEGDVSYSHIWWEQTVPVYYFQNGAPVGQDVVTFAVPAPLDLVHAGLAYVGDYSFLRIHRAPEGIPVPLRGGRRRGIALLPHPGRRRARLPLPQAVRVCHPRHDRRAVPRRLGQPALSDYYLGDPGLVRGYEYYSMISNEGAGNANIPQINRLFGSRIAVVKAELRLPVLGNADIGLLVFP